MTKEPAKYGAHVVEDLIVTIRGQKVILDSDLARIYGVSTSRLNEAVKRNRERFPPDFAFRIERREVTDLMSQIATSSCKDTGRRYSGAAKHGGRRKLPWAYTEHGALMAANVLRSPRATAMSVFVVRAFVRMRRFLADQRDLARKLAELERRLTARLDVHETAIVNVLRQVLSLLGPPAEPPPEPLPRKIGFGVREPRARYGSARRGE